MRYINDLRDGDMISEIYLCKNKQSAKTKAGKTYYNVDFQDKTGTINGKIWTLGPGIEHFEAMDYVKVDAQVTVFQGANQLNITRVRKCQEGEYDPADYMPSTEKDTKQMYEELLALIDTIKNEKLRRLVQSFFAEDKDFAARFRSHSAAKSVHHAFMGGLLEHTLSVAKLCNYFAQQYPVLNRDLLLSAAVFHDIGKLYEISPFPENDYTDNGNLLGHIVIGTMIVRDRIKALGEFPPQLAAELEHCILAHHGELEFGSPKKPALIEAVALSFADNIDAKLETFQEALASADGDGWTGYNRMFETNIRPTGSNDK
jgi:3'-5' exoribonuclease